MYSKGIASGGNLVVDYVKTVDCFPRQGNLATIFDTSRSVGGATPNVLINLSKMDRSVPLSAIGFVGDDENGEYVSSLLEEYGVDTDMVSKHPKLGTSYTDVMAVSSTGDRTFFHYRGANSDLGPEQFDFSAIDADIIHIGYALLLDKLDGPDKTYGTVMAKTLAQAQKSGIKTSLDVVSENSNRFSMIVPPSLRYTNYCVINEVEAAMITGLEARRENGGIDVRNIKTMCEKLFEMGVGDWAIIHAPELGCGMEKSGRFYIEPSVDVPREYIKGKVGAGDAFCSGVLYSAYMGWDMEKALKMAAATAACNLSEANTTDGMKTVAEAWEIYNRYPKTKISV